MNSICDENGELVCIDPHEIVYRIYPMVFESHISNTYYRILECDEWDEEHCVELLANAELERIFDLVDIIGNRDMIVNRDVWEEELNDKKYELKA